MKILKAIHRALFGRVENREAKPSSTGYNKPMEKEAGAEQSLGALPNEYDNRDIPAGAVLAPVERPRKYKTDISFLGVEDQRSHGSCVGQAEGKQVEFFEYDELNRVVRVSKRFIYSECKKRDGIPDIQGTYPRIAAKVLSDLGAALEDDVPDNNRLPYDEYVKPIVSADTYEDAKQRKVKGYVFVNAFDQEEILQTIYQKKVLPATIIVGDTSRLPIKPNPARGSHRILLIGYEEADDRANRGRVKIYFLNSWGDDWGKDGEGWFWLDEYLGFLFDVMAYTDIPNEILEEAKNTPFIFTRTLKRGMTGTDVLELQKRLASEPYKGGGMCYEAGYFDVHFGPITEGAVKRYQETQGIVSHGTPETTGYGQVGPTTRRFLNGEEDKGLYPKVARMRDSLKEICELAGFPIVVTDEYRSKAEQDALYAKGRTTEGPIVTNAKGGDSLHNWRCAFDVAFKAGSGITYEGPWEKVGRIAEILGLEWGGRWTSFVDKPHFQHTEGYSIDDFKAGRVDETRFD